MKKSIILGLLILILVVIVLAWSYRGGEKRIAFISSFEECIARGYPLLESYPRQCKTPDGKTFIEDIGNELEKIDLIKLENPRPNQTIVSPLFIKGEARGYWFFEASFPIRLYDGTGREIALTIAQTKSDWMTEDFVPFEAVLEFTTPDTKEGILIFEKDNPSGLPELDDELRIPIKFSEATQKIQLYYYNQKRDKEIADYIPCSPDAVLPVEREIPISQTPIQDTINLLLQGSLTAEEKILGFSPIFPLEGLKLVGANLKNGTLTLEFEDPFNKTGGGSCMVRLLWAQIEKTAKQFSGVDEVKFTPEWLFQP